MPAIPNLTNEDWLAIEREYCARSLTNFVRRVWGVYDPSSPLVWGWHIDAICEHLEAVTSGEITRLLINVPPGTMKSSLVNVIWPAWEWGAAGLPHHRIISAAHEQGLAIRDNRAMRRIVQSDWYQELWPMVIAADQNQKTFFENESTGFRQACAVSSMTGRRGHRILWDDPLSAEHANSEPQRETVIREFTETLPSRYVSPKDSANVIVMQRLHERDPSGYILENDLGYEHLCLPMEYEPERKCKTSIGFSDPREKEGELLFPERFPTEVVERDKAVMGSYAVAGQFQQRPAPRTGGFFAWQNLEIVKAHPQPVEVVRYWDKAGTKDGGARTAGVKIAKCKDGNWYVLDVVKGQWAAPERERTIKQTAQTDGKNVKIWIEQEPGSGGKESAESTIRNLAGFIIKSERATGEKSLRAEPYSVQVEAGNIKLVTGDWNKDFIDEHKTFPVGKYKDQIDAASGAFNKLSSQNTARIRSL